MLNIDDLFKGRNFDWEIIILCVRGYLIDLTTESRRGGKPECGD